jgi:hypothetical protein
MRFFSRIEVVPQAGEIGRERQDLGPFLVGDDPGIASARVFIGLLSGRQGAQPIIPFRFEDIGHEPILGIDVQEAAVCDLRVVACPLDLLLADVVGLGRARDELMLDRERHLKRQWRHPLDEHVADRVVE